MVTADSTVAMVTTTTTCGSLLHELQEIWDEIGESDSDRDKTLLQLEQECLDIYRKKVEQTRKYKANLHQAFAEAEAEITDIISALGLRASVPRSDNVKDNLKERISALQPLLNDLRLKKEKKIREFLEVQLQMGKIRAEIAGNSQFNTEPNVNEDDLTEKKLGELKAQLKELQEEKTFRLQKVDSCINAIHALSVVMLLDFGKLVAEVHPSLVITAKAQPKSISNETLSLLTGLVNSLKLEKEKRLKKLQDLGRTLKELWSLMETSAEEQMRYCHVTCLISSSIDEVSKQGCLSLDFIEQAEEEVERLNVLKASKMRELVVKRQVELEEIYRGVHMDVDSDTARDILTSLMDSGNVDLHDLLESMDGQIAKAKEEAISRKDILDKVEKWKHAAEEESWLDEYERDDNRYTAGRGAHKNLKRAEKARILVGKISSLVENLSAKVKSWEAEKGIPFLYEKAPLLHMLEEYGVSRQQREEEKRKSREQKRLQEQFATEQEAIYGSRPKKPLGQSSNLNDLATTPGSRRLGPSSSRYGVSDSKERKDRGKVGTVIPINYVALPKED